MNIIIIETTTYIEATSLVLSGDIYFDTFHMLWKNMYILLPVNFSISSCFESGGSFTLPSSSL